MMKLCEVEISEAVTPVQRVTKASMSALARAVLLFILSPW